MTNLTRLRLILVDLSGLMKKKTHLKQNILFVKVYPNWSNLDFNEGKVIGLFSVSLPILN